MSSAPPPGVTRIHVPTWLFRAVVTALIGVLIRLAFTLEGKVIEAYAKIGEYEARVKQLEDNRKSDVMRTDEQAHRIEALERNQRTPH